MSKVIVSNQYFDAEHVRENPGLYAAKLQRAKVLEKYALCGCSSPQLRVQIRELSGFFYLAVWPKEGPMHQTDCYFYRDEVQQEAEEAAKRNSIVELGDGTVTIKPDFAMGVATANSKTSTLSPGEPDHRTSRRRASLLAILVHLWSASKNNQWFGGSRSYNKVVWHLWLQMRRTQLGNKEMTQACMLPGIREQRADEFMQRLTPSAQNAKVQTAMLIGRVLSIDKTEFGHRIVLQNTNVNVYISNAIHQNLTQRFGFAMRAIKSQSGYCVVLAAHFQAKVGKSGGTPYIDVMDASLLVTTEHFIPVDSSYERRLSDALVGDGRRFTKPLAVEEGLMPDFILDDTPKPVYLEVWGMDSPEYLARKQEKRQIYRSRNMPIWEWDAQQEPDPPALPLRSGHFGNLATKHAEI